MVSRPSSNPRRPLPGGAYRKPALDFSMTGLVYVLMMLFMGLAAINTQANLLFGVFGLMIGALLVSGSISRTVLRKLEVRRTLPETLMVGRRATIQYEFTNDKRFWPSLSVVLAEIDGADAFTKQPQTYLLHAAAGMTARVPMEVVPRRRGVYKLGDCQVSTAFPFGFIKRAIARHISDSLVVYPARATVDRRLLSMCTSAETSSARMRPRRGGNDEFYGLKEFRTGENPRTIYWRRSAHTGVLVSREMTQVSPPRIMLLVDTYMKTRSEAEHAAVERTIAMAASLAQAALDAGLSVGLHAWSDAWVNISPNRGKQHGRDLMVWLSRLALNQTVDMVALIDSGRRLLKVGTTPVLLTPRSIELSLFDTVRSSWVTLSAPEAEAAGWFHFAPDTDFARCMPPEQDPSHLAPPPAPRSWRSLLMGTVKAG